MRARRVDALLRAGVACVLIAGCAAGGTPATTGDAAGLSAVDIIAARDTQAVRPGKSTKAEVTAIFGKATIVRFDSGFEVWVYRLKDPADARSRNEFAGLFTAKRTGKAVVRRGEFVVLFAPNGVVAKTRIREANGAAA